MNQENKLWSDCTARGHITIPHSQFQLDISIVIDITQARKFQQIFDWIFLIILIITQTDLSNKSVEIEN